MAEELQNARFDQLPLSAGPQSGFPLWMGFRNQWNGVTERFDFSAFFTSPSGDFRWFGDQTYAIGIIVTYGGLIWESQQNANIGHTPGTDVAWWIERSKSASGLVFWAAGVFTETEAFVLYERNSVAFLFRLDPALTRPFSSTNFLTELAAGNWIQAFKTPTVVVLTTGGTITFDLALLAKVRYVASAAIAAPKTWAVSNKDNADSIEMFRFEITGGLHAQTMPSNFFMTQDRPEWNPTTKIWTPSFIGRYQADAEFDKVANEWYFKIHGPF